MDRGKRKRCGAGAKKKRRELPALATSAALPMQYWGLDPLYWASVKLFVSQLKTLPRASHMQGIPLLFGRPIYRVHIMGYVVSLSTRGTGPIKYIVDDGTDTITVTQFIPYGTEDRRAAALCSFGDLVAVTGRVSDYYDQMELIVQSMAVQHDLNAEFVHWLDVIKLCTQQYNKRNLAAHLLQANSLSAKSMLYHLSRQFLRASTAETLTQHALVREPALLELAQSMTGESKESLTMMFGQVLQDLVERGYLTRTGSSFSVVSVDRHLVPLASQLVSDVLRKHEDVDDMKGSRAYAHGVDDPVITTEQIKQRVRASYPNASNDIIAEVITALCDSSQVYEVTKGVYGILT